MSRESLLQHALSLSPDDRVQLIEDLLQSVVDSSSGFPELDASQQADLFARQAAHRADPTAAIPWEEVERLLADKP